MKNTVKGIIALILALVLSAGVCCMGYASRDDSGKWFGNFKNISEWHWADPKPDEDNGDEANGENLVMTLSDNYAEMSLTPLSSTPNSKTVTITATVEPGTAENKEVYFSLAQSNGSPASQYMSLTVDGNAATVICLKAFPVQIVLTATAVGNSNLVETCTFDYLAGVSDVEFQYDISGWANIYSYGESQIYFKPVYGTGTIMPEDFQPTSLFFELSQEFANEVMSNNFYNQMLAEATSNSLDLTNKIFLEKTYPSSDTNNLYLEDDWWVITTFVDCISFCMSDEQTPLLTGNARNCLEAAFKQEARKTTDNLRIGINWKAKYNGELKGSTYYTDYLSINADDIEAGLIDGNDINLDHSNVVFGDL